MLKRVLSVLLGLSLALSVCTCLSFGEGEPMLGDVDGNGVVDNNDAIHLLYNTIFGDEDYPLNQTCDFSANGKIDNEDAIYLLYHTIFPESYPLDGSGVLGPIRDTELMENFDPEILCPSNYSAKKNNVTYGEMVRTKYYSTTCEKNRNVIVLLPAGYDESKEYPVMYILHGIFGDETSMIGDGNSGIRIILGNLMNEGLAEDMIVVFPYMYASKTQDYCTGIDKENSLAYDNFVNDLVNDLMPFMAKNYAVAEGRDNTAIIGFSMGGRESLAIGFAKPELIGYIGAIAPAPGLTPGRDWAMEHYGQYKEEELVFGDVSPYFLMICSGDRDGTVGSFPKSYHNILNKNKVEHVWYEIPGSDHGDPAISSGIYNFAITIFK